MWLKLPFSHLAENILLLVQFVGLETDLRTGDVSFRTEAFVVQQ